ncbi:MAG: HD domain-containing protein [Miltoncostaeaceae bacterium]
MSAEAGRALRAPLAALAASGVATWLVGGGIRDALMGRTVADMDLAIAGDAAPAAAALARAAGADRYPLSRAFGSWRITGGDLPFQVDITPLQGPDIAADLARRDLTVNAIALPLVPQDDGDHPVDPTGGMADLAAGRLRLVDDGALRQDPVRLLRLARLATQLEFSVEPGTAARARADAGRLWEAPGERLAEELGRIASLPRADLAVRGMDALGVLGALSPELEDCRGVEQNPYHHLDALGHTLEVVEHAVALAADPEPVFRGVAPRVSEVLARPLADGLSAREGLVLAAIFHDMAKAETKRVLSDGRIGFMGHDIRGAEMVEDLFGRLRTSARLRDTVALAVRRHLPLGFLVHRTPLSLRQIDRYLRSTAPAEAEIIVLTVADRLATRGARTTESAIRRHLVLAREVMAQHFALVDRGPVEPLVRGDALARALGRTPGPWLAELVEALREEQLVGHITTPAQAHRFAAAWDAAHPG